MLALQRGCIQLSYSRLFCARDHSTTTHTSSPTQFVVTNTSNGQDTDKSTHVEFKNALQNIPRRILHELLRKNRIKVGGATNHQNNNYKRNVDVPKQLLLSKLYRLCRKHIHKSNVELNKTRVEVDVFVRFSSGFVRKTCLKLRNLNAYYNTNYDAIVHNVNHSFHHTLCTLIKEIHALNTHETMNCTAINKKDILFELLPSIRTETANDINEYDRQMLALCDSFIQFMHKPRFTLLDHIQYIS
eukprot:144426_1